jgi:hypothetical protein
MENLKHTKGEWQPFMDNGELYVTAENTRQSICKLPIKYSHSEANAKLIAASPDLLEALINLKETIEGIGWDGYYNNIVKEALNKTDNAINKATK